MKIAVVTDSGCGLTKKEAEELGLFYLPLQIVDGDKSYFDGVDITTKEIFEMIKEGKMLKTSLTPIGMIEELFEELKEKGYEHIICVPITSGLSSMMNSVRMAAMQVEIEISIIETYTTYFIQRYIATSAKRLVDENVELNEIIERLEESVEYSNTYLIPEDLNHLKRGGRLTPLAAALAGMLKIKPILTLCKNCEGKVDTFAKVRTMSKALREAVDQVEEEVIIDDDYILAIAHTDALETAEQLKQLYFGKYEGRETYFGDLCAVIAVHTGMGSVGIQYIKKV